MTANDNDAKKPPKGKLGEAKTIMMVKGTAIAADVAAAAGFVDMEPLVYEGDFTFAPDDLPSSIPDSLPDAPIGGDDLPSEVPSRRTVRAAEPALAESRATEAYSGSTQDQIRQQIEEARRRAASSAAEPAEPKVAEAEKPVAVVAAKKEAASKDDDATWMSGPIGQKPPPQVRHCTLVKKTEEGWLIKRSERSSFSVPPSRVLAVGVGAVNDPDKTPALYVDIVTNWSTNERGPVVLRLKASELPLDKLCPELVGTEEGVRKVLQDIAAPAHVVHLPRQKDWPGNPIRTYTREADMDLALYATL